MMNKAFKKTTFSLMSIMLAASVLFGCQSNNVTEEQQNDATTGATTANVVAGTYTGTAAGFGGDVVATVEVDDEGTILSIDVDASGETPTIGGAAAPKLAASIVEHQSLAVDTISGATGTSNSVLTAVEDALGQAGFDVELMKNRKVTKTGVDEEVTVELVVVGAGGSGTAAALAAAEAGTDVLIIEMTNSVGGNSMLASGMFAVESTLQKEEGLNLTVDEAVSQLLEFNQYLSNGPLTRAIVEKSASTVDWLESYGMEFYLPSTTTQAAHEDNLYKWKAYHKFVDSQAGFENFYTHLEEMGAEVRTNTSLNEILQAEDGTVTGITATKEDGGILTVNADAVIIATGGYGANTEKVYENLHTDLVYSLGVANFGEGIDAAIEAGGIPWDSSTALLHAAQLANSSTGAQGHSEDLLTQVLMAPLLWVDASGTRIGSEDAIYDTVFWSNVAYSAGGRYYIIVDEATLEDFSNGANIKLSDAGPGYTAGTGDFVAMADAAVEAGSAFKGSTLEELAASTGMKVEELEETVARYNTMVQNKKDTDYGKSADSLVYEVSEGNYYAFEARAVYLGTVGGVKVNEKLEVIDLDYNAIPGLYVVGSSAGGYYSNGSYPPYEGLACGFAYTSGRIAGENAAQYIQNK